MNCSPSPAAEQDEERWREVDEERLRELKKKKKTGLNCDVADSGQRERKRGYCLFSSGSGHAATAPLILGTAVMQSLHSLRRTLSKLIRTRISSGEKASVYFYRRAALQQDKSKPFKAR